eukprot:1158108-Pelagomonas_calceolata.AAC.1
MLIKRGKLRSRKHAHREGYHLSSTWRANVLVCRHASVMARRRAGRLRDGRTKPAVHRPCNAKCANVLSEAIDSPNAWCGRMREEQGTEG